MNKAYFLLLATAILFSGCIRDDEGEWEEPDPKTNLVNVGDQIPVFNLNGNEQRVFDSSALTAELTLISLFNPGCRDCSRELPKLQYVYQNLKHDDRFELVAIARDMTLQNLSSHSDGSQWMTMPCYPDPDRAVYDRFATGHIPRVYLVGRDGIVKKMWVEYIWENKQELSKEEFLATVKSYLD